MAFWFILAHLELNLWFLTIYSLIMGLFGLVHERIWHDSNYGITPNDVVEIKRDVLKALTYRGVSFTIMTTALYGLLGHVPWGVVVLYQSCTLIVYIALEMVWASIPMGVKQVHHE